MKNLVTATILAMVVLVGAVGCSSKAPVAEEPETVYVEEERG